MVSNADIEQKMTKLRSGKLSVEENVKHFLASIEKNNEKYNIFLEINKNAQKRAKELDNKLKNKEPLGALFGLVIAIKSNISIKEMHISCASKTLGNYKGTFNADVIDKIEAQDGVIIGIVNNDEFASGSSGENSAFGNTDNPAAPGRIPGGSSSGSAASIAADMADLALGSDTGGSIRNPASHCGVSGVKPSYGRVSRYGLVDLAMSFDQIGPFSKDVYGTALLLSIIAGFSESDPTTVDKPVIHYTKEKPKGKYKIGVIPTFDAFITDDRIKKLFDKKVEKLKKLGHTIIEKDIECIDLAIQAYYPIVYTEFFSGTRKLDGVKYGKKIEDSCGPEALRRILGGQEISKSEYDGAYYKKSLKVKDIIGKEFEKAFKEVDFFLIPVTPSLPHKLGTSITVEQMYAYDAFTIPANLAGICAGTVSVDTIPEDNENVPVGMQVFANKFREDLLFQGMYLLESLNK